MRNGATITIRPGGGLMLRILQKFCWEMLPFADAVPAWYVFPNAALIVFA